MSVSQFGRYQTTPIGDEKFLSTEQDAKVAATYLMDELPSQFKNASARHTLLVKPAKEGDAVNNAGIS